MSNPLFPQATSAKAAVLWPGDTTLSDEGGYFITTNPYPGTAIATTSSVVDDGASAASTHAQFAPAAIIYNSASVTDPNAPSIYLRYIKLIINLVPAAASSWKYALRLDNVNRYSSGGLTLTPVNVNPASPRGTKAQVYFGAIVPTGLPSANSKLVANGQVANAVPTSLDQWLFDATGGAGNTGGATSTVETRVAPIVIPPGWSLSLEMWGPGNSSAPSWEFEIAHVERISGQ
jgi:hypothetical protein